MAGCSSCPLSWFCILCEPNLFKKCYACNIYYCSKCNIELAYYKHIFKHITNGTNDEKNNGTNKQIHSQLIQTQNHSQSNQTQNQLIQSNQKQQKIFNPTKIRIWSIWKCNICVQGY